MHSLHCGLKKEQQRFDLIYMMRQSLESFKNQGFGYDLPSLRVILVRHSSSGVEVWLVAILIRIHVQARFFNGMLAIHADGDL